ncbi:ribonuclease G [Tistrella bauzanensis]|uniref:Ribonuclease G n=1 Tax=Tistrella bauzanensis TaxID=657419 RepID=A0ABQ1IXL4_9PROT|nr:Rne/Rng family ribonuclease [Tistrella bauzanensis]GGB52959.1 ribonuclease G [Tistrella bauzanensis]
MTNRLLIDQAEHETRVALIEGDRVVDVQIERLAHRSAVGNIYLGKVSRVLPGMQAAFVSVGLGRNAFLHADDARVLPRARAAADRLSREASDAAAANAAALAAAAAAVTAAMEPDETDAEVEVRPATPLQTQRSRRLMIGDCVADGDQIMVQVTKDAVKGKGARLTANISLPGRHLVFTPFQGGVGVSRRIDSEVERERLHEIVQPLTDAGEGGFIVRTAAEGASAAELEADAAYLRTLWADLEAGAARGGGPRPLHVDLDPLLRSLRDQAQEGVAEMLIDEPVAYERALAFARRFMPHLVDRIRLWDRPEGLFDSFGVEDVIAEALQPRVRLPSGGFVVIDQTEALTAVDVNTGRFVGEADQEATVMHTNLEAAEVIAHQLRLRNLGGLIVVDFIDMERTENRQKLYDAFRAALVADRASTTVLPMSELGLVQMTRKRGRESLSQVLTEDCDTCGGTGRVKSAETVAYEVMRAARRLLLRPRPGRVAARALTVMASPDVAALLTDSRVGMVEAVSELTDAVVEVRADPSMARDAFDLAERD